MHTCTNVKILRIEHIGYRNRADGSITSFARYGSGYMRGNKTKTAEFAGLTISDKTDRRRCVNMRTDDTCNVTTQTDETVTFL